VISPKTSGTMAHLWATTLPTPPAPMRRTLFMGMLSEGVGESGPAGKEFPVWEIADNF
jgi:hypothetical protein